MIRLIGAELIKLKRRWLFVPIPAIFLIFVFIYIKNMFGGIQGFNVQYLFGDTFPIIYLLYIFVISLLAMMIFSEDYKSGMIRQIVTIPINMTMYFLAKLCLITLVSVLILLGVYIEFIAISLYYQCPEITLVTARNIFFLYMFFAVTIIPAMTPLFLVMTAARQEVLVPMVSTLLYLSVIFLPSIAVFQITGIGEEIVKYFFPPGSLLSIMDYLCSYFLNEKFMGLTEPLSGILLSALSIILYFVCFTFLSVKLLKAQQH